MSAPAAGAGIRRAKGLKLIRVLIPCPSQSSPFTAEAQRPRRKAKCREMFIEFQVLGGHKVFI
jgi:hypothetical protein